jgi:hypothetical protein
MGMIYILLIACCCKANELMSMLLLGPSPFCMCRSQKAQCASKAAGQELELEIKVQGKTQRLVSALQVDPAPTITAYAAVYGGANAVGPAQLEAWGFPAAELKTLQIPINWTVSVPPGPPPSSWLPIELPPTANSKDQKPDVVEWDDDDTTLQARLVAKHGNAADMPCMNVSALLHTAALTSVSEHAAFAGPLQTLAVKLADRAVGSPLLSVGSNQDDSNDEDGSDDSSESSGRTIQTWLELPHSVTAGGLWVSLGCGQAGTIEAKFYAGALLGISNSKYYANHQLF